MPHRTQGSVTGGAFPGRGRAWQPLLQGVWRERALEAVRAIAHALLADGPRVKQIAEVLDVISYQRISRVLRHSNSHPPRSG